MNLKKSVIRDIWNGDICISEKEYSIKNKEYINVLYRELENIRDNNNEELKQLDMLYQKILDIAELEAFRKGVKFAIELYNDTK